MNLGTDNILTSCEELSLKERLFQKLKHLFNMLSKFLTDDVHLKMQDRCRNNAEIDHQVAPSYSVYGVSKVSSKLSLKHQCIMTDQVHDQSFITLKHKCKSI